MSFTDPCAGTYGAPPALVEEPTTPLWPYGLYSVATIIDNPDDHERNGIKYKSFRCVGTVENWEDSCVTDDLEPKAPTDSGEENVVRGCPFHMYAALSCKTTTLAAMSQNVEEVFRNGEQVGVETQIWNRVLATSAATVLNPSSMPGDAFTVLGGIAALEQAMATCYSSQATFHMPRGVGAYLFAEHQLDLCSDPTPYYMTKLGSKVAFYAGTPNSSPAGVAAPTGYAWMYATSELTLRRFAPEILPEDSDLRLQYNPLTNEPFVVAERTYVPSVECCQFAVLVTLVDA